MTLLLTYLFVALSVSFLCSLVEAVLLSAPFTFLKAKSEKGDLTARKFIKLKQEIDRPLSAILSLNTVAHTVGAAGVGAQAAVVYGDTYFGLVSALLTLLILVFTEIIPKTLGANYSRELIPFTLITIRSMIVVAYPLVVLSAALSKLLSRKGEEITTSREEFSALATIGTQEGIFHDKENKIIQNLIRIERMKVDEIMTPRVVVVTANEEMSFTDFYAQKDSFTFSRIPVYRENKDNITGYIFRETVFERLAADQFDLRLKDIKRNIVVFTENVNLFNAWEELLLKQEAIALVVDEYGGMSGIATQEDIVETMLGFEILDEKDRHPDMQKYALERWQKIKKKYGMQIL